MLTFLPHSYFTRTLLIVFIILFFACKKDKTGTDTPSTSIEDAPSVSIFEDASGTTFKVLTDGRVFQKLSGSATWEFVMQYFDPDFKSKNYSITNAGTFLKTESGALVPVQRYFKDDFERYSGFVSAMKKTETDTLKWTDFTLLSPSAKTIPEYVNLRKCILNSTCTFIDNTIATNSSLIPNDTCLKFNAVAPTSDMVTSKSSLESTLLFFEKNDDLWFEADYYITQYPLTLVDFESQWFDQGPGMRIMFLNGNEVAMELKYGNKPLYKQPNVSKITFPLNQWVKLKVHLTFQDDNTGIIQVWQNNVLIIDAVGQNLPTSNCIITNLEIGISATPQIAEVYLDNVRLSDSGF